MKKSSGDTVKTKIGKEELSKKPKIEEKMRFDAEPALLIHMGISIMVVVVVNNLFLEKACHVNLGYSDEVCDALISKTPDAEKYLEEEKEIQKYIGNVLVWRTILENIFPMMLVLLIGPWSDKYGRKLPMLFVIVGLITQHVVLILCAYFKFGIGAWTVAIVTSVIPGLTGNQASFGMAIFSYVADTTSVEKRTVRTGITHTCFFFGITLGLAAGGIVSNLGLSFVQVFAGAAVVECLVFAYVHFVIKNTRDEKAIKGKTSSDMFKDLLDTKHARDAISSVFKKRSGSVRMTLIILLVSHVLIMAPMMGEMGVLNLFGRYKFGWAGGEVAYFMTYKMVLGFFGNFISMGVLGKALNMSDAAIGITCCISGLIGNIIFAYANSPLVMFIGPVVQILASAAIIVPRSIISKIIPTNEMGKVGSFFACLDSIVPLLSAPIYTLLYTKTFETFPGAFFLLSAALMIPPILSFTWVRSSEEMKSKKN